MHSEEDLKALRRDHHRWLVEQGPGVQDTKGRTAEEYFAANWPDTESAGEMSLG